MFFFFFMSFLQRKFLKIHSVYDKSVGHPLRIRASKLLGGKYFHNLKYLTVKGTLLKLPTEKQLSPGLTAPVRTWWRFMTPVYRSRVYLLPLSFLHKTLPLQVRFMRNRRRYLFIFLSCKFTSVSHQTCWLLGREGKNINREWVLLVRIKFMRIFILIRIIFNVHHV